MYDTYQMQEHICKELEKKAQTGLKSTQDLDTVWKLIDAYKNLLKIDMLQEAEEYSHEDGYSERRRRDSRGRYSREGGGNSYDDGSSYRRGHGGYSEAKERYMEDKNSYRSSRSPESKRDMNVSLHDCMTKLKEELQEMMSSADTREERDKIQEMIREIGRLA
jgi:site-specific DNA-cytosine methylase